VENIKKMDSFDNKVVDKQKRSVSLPRESILRNIEERATDNNKILLYHGNPNMDFKPYFGGGEDYHDYGKGLYCVYGTSEGLELAKEWACQRNDKNETYVHPYNFEYKRLENPQILDLTEIDVLYSLSALAQHRFGANETRIRKKLREDFINLFPVDCEKYDIIKGWRADDRYYVFLNLFLTDGITYEAIREIFHVGGQGFQFVIKSEQAYFAYDCLDVITVTGDEYKNYYDRYHEKITNTAEELVALQDIDGIILSQIVAQGGI
jgi:hypothetical protein